MVVGNTAIIARIGAPSRQGEEAPVAAALAALGCTVHHLTPPATLDGGDVLQLPGSRHILVGLSRRTNAAAVTQLSAALPQHSVHGVSVPHGLHLKSAITALDGGTLLLADNAAGRGLSAALQGHAALAGSPWQHVMVPDPGARGRRLCSGGSGGLLLWHTVLAFGFVRLLPTAVLNRPCPPACLVFPHLSAVAANVLLLGGGHVAMQAGCAASEALLGRLCSERGLRLHTLPRATELVKADGALTCCSILLPDEDD